MQHVGVIGAGSWGTALAFVCARAGRQVSLWARDPETVRRIIATGENHTYLPGRLFPQNIDLHTDLDFLQTCDVVLLATPAQSTRYIAQDIYRIFQKKTSHAMPILPPFVVCAKGIEQKDKDGHAGKLMSDVLAETLPGAPIAILSGPTFATEVADDKPSAVTLACTESALAQKIVTALGTRHFRPYWSDDILSVQIGGALKNVMAIACGIVAGQTLGENARAALVTRGLAEIARYAVQKGGKAETLMGLSGLGDLTLTATSTQSRNYSLGYALGKGQSLQQILGTRNTIAEGMFTAHAMADQAQTASLDMPICTAVHHIVNEGADIKTTIANLLDRPFRQEGF